MYHVIIEAWLSFVNGTYFGVNILHLHLLRDLFLPQYCFHISMRVVT